MAGPSKSSDKRQASLTSFFTPRTINGLSQPRQSPRQAEQDAVSGDKDSSPTRKRPLEEDTDNGIDGQIPSIKRAKSTSEGDPSKSSFFNKSRANRVGASTLPSVATRTERYAYGETHSTNVDRTEDPEDEDEAEAVRIQKEKLHEKFVKKLGHPDSMAMIRRRNFQLDDGAAGADEDGDPDDAEEEEAPRSKTTKKKGAKTGKLTPMELQFLDIKRKHMDTVLIVEVGYKFRFFGEDARIAAKELSIVCIPGKFRYDERRLSPKLPGLPALFAKQRIRPIRSPPGSIRLCLNPCAQIVGTCQKAGSSRTQGWSRTPDRDCGTEEGGRQSKCSVCSEAHSG